MHLKQRLVRRLLPALIAEICAMHAGHALAADPQAGEPAEQQSATTNASRSANAVESVNPQRARREEALKAVSVTATRGGTADPSRTAATVSVVTSDDIDENNAKDVKDALKYEPGVEVRRSVYRPAGITGSTGRAGNEGINIRGLEGNQVLLLEDGVPLPQSYAFGSGSAGRGDYLNTDLYQRIEVLRGPTSALYGSDGLTGAVNFVTKDPSDLLAIYNKKTYFSLKAGYDSTDRSWGSTATAAFGGDVVQGMIALSGRHGHETDNKGDSNTLGASRSTPDPLTYNNRSALGKLVFKLTPHDTLKLTAETLSNANSSDGLSQLGGAYTWSGYTANGYVTGNEVNSNRVQLDYDHRDATNPYFQQLHASLYYRNASTRQTLDISGANASGATSSRSRTNDYGDNILGGSVVADSAFNTGVLQHKLTYGFDASVSHYSTASSAGSEWTSNADGYPEAFPKTTQTSLGAFVQDEIRWNKLSVVPGVRFDYYDMTPHPDATYESMSASSTKPTSTSTGNAVSPRLAILYEVSPAFVPYVQYAHGFRAPSAYQVNSFYNPAGSYGLYYQQVGNPNLKPETSNSVEVGLRGKLGVGHGQVNYSAAAFAGSYSNFIDSKVVGGSLTSATNPYTVQYVNYSKASIQGLEGKADWYVNDALEVKGGFAWIHGTETKDGVTSGLDTVPPLAVVLGVKYAPTERWFASADLTYNSRKSKSQMSSSSYFATPSYTILDLHAGVNITRHVSVTAGINNVFDRKYWVWNDVRGLADSDGAAKIDAYTAPGRNFNVAMKIDF
ncbi:TonB-dependent hemoglobin/transferrin/lactoferrin family receptor [Paraburkholderia tropica]|uniref:Hemoglobin/transferrin/lactoferrin receptor protein n=1 Tax=Paraburkholderia tropica TaxID=92647 RepID=A0ABX5MQY6_9BURK|nr:TonB-dependent hemoglobin/transferrin/lactoferrin family receptor [Paraburkholderia tropica]MDE1144455.1 TonB-dependent hemoglobin/transferrin/lactoferrin family receptor [Paraburkholderia tropica]PXX17346.1 hemoglobin/transferrin/lactoferrin receptor protein [Paraburkholderia tropica]PZW84527.1 hemoglobin/transferrin/lactoferrin receptor protein [Paraburkholderia tropica]